MKIKILLIVIFGFSTGLFAQKINEYTQIDKLVLQIPDTSILSTKSIAEYINNNFSTDSDKSRAIFAWITKNIQYDIENMYAVNFYESIDEVINKVLKTHKGICMGYAALFNDISTKTGIKSYMISGYTKQNGFVDYISHAWCAALIDSSWLLFDPTWGSGYIQNSKFIQKINNFYFKTKPEQLNKSHIPFDPLWQFLNYPVTNQEFYEGKYQINTKKDFFNYTDTLIIYEAATEIDKLISSSSRIEKNGVKNSLIFDRLQHNKHEIEYYNNKQVIEQYNFAVNLYNEGINGLNHFIDFRNNQFTPTKPDNEIREMIDTTEHSLINSKKYLGNIKKPDDNTKTSMIQLYKSIDEALQKTDEQRVFLNKYFKTAKWRRKSLFYKSTFFGVPLN